MMIVSMQKQVDKSHYDFTKYMSKARWTSLWHQLDEVTRLHPRSLLEIGPGIGIFKIIATAYGLNVKTLDIDPALAPDYVASADQMPLEDASFDVVCAFQILEHMPFETSMKAFAECCRVARNAVVISLPDVETAWPSIITIPKFGSYRLILPRPFFKPQEHTFNGEHYWEINKKNYPLAKIITALAEVARDYEVKTYRVHENLYHRFFIFTKTPL